MGPKPFVQPRWLLVVACQPAIPSKAPSQCSAEVEGVSLRNLLSRESRSFQNPVTVTMRTLEMQLLFEEPTPVFSGRLYSFLGTFFSAFNKFQLHLLLARSKTPSWVEAPDPGFP